MPRDDALGDAIARFARDDLEGRISLRIARYPEPPPHLLLAARAGFRGADVGPPAVLELESFDRASHDPPWFRKQCGATHFVASPHAPDNPTAIAPDAGRSDSNRSRSKSESDLHRVPTELSDLSPQDAAGSCVLVQRQKVEGWSDSVSLDL